VPPDRPPRKAASSGSNAIVLLLCLPLVAALLWVAMMILAYLRNEPWGPN